MISRSTSWPFSEAREGRARNFSIVSVVVCRRSNSVHQTFCPRSVSRRTRACVAVEPVQNGAGTVAEQVVPFPLIIGWEKHRSQWQPRHACGRQLANGGGSTLDLRRSTADMHKEHHDSAQDTTNHPEQSE